MKEQTDKIINKNFKKVEKKIENHASELERNNKIAMYSHLVEVIIITLFCVLEATTRGKSWLFVIILTIIGFVPVICEFIAWGKNRESQAIRHFVAIGYAVFYTCTIFTTSCSAIYVMALPMIFIVSVYNDFKYMLMVNTGVVIESFISVFIGASTGKFGYLGLDAAAIQIVTVLITGVLACLLALTTKANAQQKIDVVKESQQKTQELLDDISQISAHMQNGIAEIYTQLEKLNDSAKLTQSTMVQVSTGAADTADAVQNQLSQTEEIQKKVSLVDTAANEISDSIMETLNILTSGSKDVEQLVANVDISVKNGQHVADKLSNLSIRIKEMHSIIAMIEEIASQTELLALNASIEAARAGEAGKGFVVVATEISKMATQTGDATENITKLIENISTAIEEVVTVIYEMIDGINAEKSSTESTAKSFDNIQNNTYAIRDNVEQLTQSIVELKNANNVIVDSIQTISAVSEQLSAHASETTNNEEENVKILENIADKMHGLIDTVKEDDSASL